MIDEALVRAIRRLAAATVVGFAFLAAVTFYWGFLRAESLAARADNPRRVVEDRRIVRGRILDRDGRVLAYSESPGPEAWAAPRRVYPYPDAAPVVGYQTWRYGAGADPAVTYGAGGAEAAYDAALRGDLGLSMGQLLASRVLHRGQTGHDVVLTLDGELQAYAAEQLGDRRGAVVVVDVETGAIRALASRPSFDPAVLDEAAAEGQADPPMLNLATQGLFPPGSTWKIVTLAAALQEDLVRPGDTVDDGDRVGYFDGFPVRCDNNPPGVRTFDILHAFGYSCNVTFAELGAALGAHRYRRYAEAFGLGRDVPFPLPSATGSLSADDELSLPELASAAFGQGEVTVTPLHMALVAAGIAADGAMPVPYLLDSVPGVRWSRLADERGTWLRPVGGRAARAVREAMVVSAEDGWGRSARAAGGVSMGAKTGTAETGQGAPHAWTVAYAPAQEPRLATAVLVVEGGSGSEVAAPIAGRVLAEALRLESVRGRAP